MFVTSNKLKKYVYENSDLIAILGIGTLLRLKDITKFEFWYDEAFTGLMSKIPREEFVATLKRDVHPPLFLLLIRGWSTIFGSTDMSLRFLPLLFGVATLILLFKVTQGLFGKRAAVITLLLASVSPFLIQYSYEARSYSMFAFFVLLSFYLATLKKPTFFFLSLLILVNIHFMSMLFLPGLLLTYAYFNYFPPKDNLRKQIFTDILGLTILSITILMFERFFLQQTTVHTIEWARNSSFESIPRSFTAYLFGVKSKLTGSDALLDYKLPIGIQPLGYIAFVAFLIETFLHFRQLQKGKRLRNLIILTNLLLPQILLISFGLLTKKNLYVERYLLPASLFLFIFLGVLFVENAKFETMAVYVVVYMFILSFQKTPDYYQGMKSLKKELRYIPGEIVFTKPINFVIGKYYLYDMENQLKIYDPENPNLNYAWWPFIEERDFLGASSPSYISPYTLFVIPSGEYVPPYLEQISPYEEYNNYSLYIKAD